MRTKFAKDIRKNDPLEEEVGGYKQQIRPKPEDNPVGKKKRYNRIKEKKGKEEKNP